MLHHGKLMLTGGKTITNSEFSAETLLVDLNNGKINNIFDTKKNTAYINDEKTHKMKQQAQLDNGNEDRQIQHTQEETHRHEIV